MRSIFWLVYFLHFLGNRLRVTVWKPSSSTIGPAGGMTSSGVSSLVSSSPPSISSSIISPPSNP